MFGIYLTNGALDVYEQDASWEWTSIRFSEGLQDAYTTDIVIPKNRNNIWLLDAAGLLDRTQQPLGRKIAPCTLSIGHKNIDAYIEVVSLIDDDINICIYEKSIENTSLKKWLVDNDNSIWEWNIRSVDVYPNYFKEYWYGMSYNARYAQYHPSMPLNDIIDRWSQASGIQMPHADAKHRVVSTNKYVCPQNKHQYIEGSWTKDSGEYAVLSGGQHITNDCSFRYSPSETKITFNRDCKVKISCYFAWKRKSNVTRRFWFDICKSTPGMPVQTFTCYIKSDEFTNYIQWDSWDNVVFKEGSTLYVRCENENKYDLLNFVLSLTITDYNITEDDYGEELKYIARSPRLTVYSIGGVFTRRINGGWVRYDDPYQYLYFDIVDNIIGFYYARTGHLSEHLARFFESEFGSFAYFGFYCNLPDIELKDLLFGLCWLDKKKVVKHAVVDNWSLTNQVDFVNADEGQEIDGNITETRISADQLGRNNYILQNGESQNTPVSTIDNDWLEEHKNLHTSPFAYTPKRYGNWGCLDQYSNPEYDSDSGEYKCDFEEVEGFPILDSGQVDIMLYHPELSTMDFDKITQSIGVTIETISNIPDLVDYVYLDGRKYMVVDINTDLNTNFSEINAILLPNEESNIATGITSNPDWQDQPDAPDEPSYPDDPDDPDPWDPDPYDQNDPDNPEDQHQPYNPDPGDDNEPYDPDH